MYWLMTPALNATSALAVVAIAEVAKTPDANKDKLMTEDNDFFINKLQ
jgi:hypothetical protein